MNIVKGRQHKPVRTLIYGEPGVGKSSFAAAAPKPLFLCAEDGAGQLDVPKQSITSWTQMLSILQECAELKEYETIVIDTLDALENMLTADIVAEAKAASINSGELGYGRGINARMLQWRPLIAALDRVRNAGKNIMTIAHGAVKKFADPVIGEYDRFAPKLDERIWGLMNEWSDDVMYASFDKGIKKGEDGKKDRAIITGERILQTTKQSGFEAKNRHNLPEQIALDGVVYWSAIAATRRSAEQIQKAIDALLKSGPKGEELKPRVTAACEKARGDVHRLSRIEVSLQQEIGQ